MELFDCLFIPFWIESDTCRQETRHVQHSHSCVPLQHHFTSLSHIYMQSCTYIIYSTLTLSLAQTHRHKLTFLLASTHAKTSIIKYRRKRALALTCSGWWWGCVQSQRASSTRRPPEAGRNAGTEGQQRPLPSGGSGTGGCDVGTALAAH